VEAGSRISISISNHARIVRECVEETIPHVGDVFCVVVEEAVAVVDPAAGMTAMKVVSGCWFVVVVQESTHLIVLVKFVLSKIRVLLQHKSLLLLLLLLLPLHPPLYLLLAMTPQPPLVPLLHQRSLVRQSHQPSKQ
jgi:hypothetical protein